MKKKPIDNPDVIFLPNGKKFNKKSWITSSLRRMSYRWAPRNLALKAARVERGLYKCAHCEELFKNGEFALDHIVPMVPHTGFPMHPVTKGPDWTIIIDRLFCDVDGFQVLCNSCHDIKTSIEDNIRGAQPKKTKKRLAKK